MALAAADGGHDEPTVSFYKGFLGQLNKFEPSDVRRVTRAIDRFSKDPRHPALHLEQIRADESYRLYTIRASDEMRVLLARVDRSWIVLEAGHHDKVYLRASTGRFVVNPTTKFVGFVTTGDTAEDELDRREDDPPEEPERVFAAWSSDDLTEAGFEPEVIELLLACTSHTELLDLDIDDEILMSAIDLVEVTPDQWRKRGGGLATKAEAAALIDESGANWGLSQHLSADEIERLLSGPIENWMIFLHPRQRGIVAGRYEGPARIGGPAGTGKTVVALHRAAELAQRFRAEDPSAKILFTTFIMSLPEVYRSLFARLPNAIPDAVEFLNIDAKARRICQANGGAPPLNTKMIDAAFSAAYKDVVTKDSPLSQSKLDRKYLREEITAVIKGRGITNVDDYMTVERTGRRFAFPEAYRREVWTLHEAWEREMKERRTRDFPDVLAQALEIVQSQGLSEYRAAIIDEAQDLTLTGLNLVRALVNGGGDQTDSLLLVGDGAQRIYTSCYTLRQAGLEVRGRTTILKRNYRNSRPILAAALAVAGDRTVDDLGEEFKRGDAEAVSELDGSQPRVLICRDLDHQWDMIAQAIKLAVGSSSIGLGDVGILLPTNRFAFGGETRLRDRGLSVVNLKNFAGQTTPEVRIGTYFRAKGLEFKMVVLPDVGGGRLPSPQRKNENDDAYQERLDLEMSAFYVAMSRARDHLLITCSDRPAEAILSATPHFEFERCS